MDAELHNRLVEKNFSSIVECIEYLWFANYPLDECISIASDLFGNTLDVNLKGITDERTLVLYNNLIGCELKTGENDEIYYVKNDKILFIQDLKHLIFWVDYEAVWSFFSEKNKMEYPEIQRFIYERLLESFKLKNYGGDHYTIKFFSSHLNEPLKEGFDLTNYIVIRKDYFTE